MDAAQRERATGQRDVDRACRRARGLDLRASRVEGGFDLCLERVDELTELAPRVGRDPAAIARQTIPLRPGEKPQVRMVRFRTLGCYPLTGAIESTATTLTDIIDEMQAATSSERQGRLIDHDSSGSMEKKKQEGYF